MKKVLWTYQRTGATALKPQLGISGSIFGWSGLYGRSKPDQVPQIIDTLDRGFKVSVGFRTRWQHIEKIMGCTREWEHIIHYRENSADRLISWYFATSTGVFSPGKLSLYEDKVEELLKKDFIPTDELIRKEIMDLSQLTLIKGLLTRKKIPFKITRYEDFYNPSEGYSYRHLYNNFSNIDIFRNTVNSNEEIQQLKALLHGKDKSPEN